MLPYHQHSSKEYFITSRCYSLKQLDLDFDSLKEKVLEYELKETKEIVIGNNQILLYDTPQMKLGKMSFNYFKGLLKLLVGDNGLSKNFVYPFIEIYEKIIDCIASKFALSYPSLIDYEEEKEKRNILINMSTNYKLVYPTTLFDLLFTTRGDNEEYSPGEWYFVMMICERVRYYSYRVTRKKLICDDFQKNYLIQKIRKYGLKSIFTHKLDDDKRLHDLTLFFTRLVYQS